MGCLKVEERIVLFDVGCEYNVFITLANMGKYGGDVKVGVSALVGRSDELDLHRGLSWRWKLETC